MTRHTAKPVNKMQIKRILPIVKNVILDSLFKPLKLLMYVLLVLKDAQPAMMHKPAPPVIQPTVINYTKT
jgi:hypothetical protein